jgi:hypothetical protein
MRRLLAGPELRADVLRRWTTFSQEPAGTTRDSVAASKVP